MSGIIHFGKDHPPLTPGTRVAIPIMIEFENQTKVRGIYAEFHGSERTTATYTVTERDSNGDTKTVTKTAVEYFDIVRKKEILQGNARKGFFGRITDSMATVVGGGDHEIIEPGKHEFLFEVDIPENAPPTLKGVLCEVAYELSVHVDIPVKIDSRSSIKFPIYPPSISYADCETVQAKFPDESGRSFWDNMFGKEVNLHMAIDRDKMSVGDVALAFLSIESPEPLKVNGIVASLIGKEDSTASGHSDAHLHTILIGPIEGPDVLDNETTFEFDLEIPPIEDAPYTQSGRNFRVQWFVQVQIKIPWAKDPIIQIPFGLYANPDPNSKRAKK